MSSITRSIQIRASFSKRGRAEAAVAAVVGAGISPSSVDLEHGVPPEMRGREGRFVWRVLVAIVLWSLAGAVPGAAFGWLLAETIGPKGTAGLVVQVVCWTIVGHLVAGMLAGYALLADRSAEEMPPDRPVSLLTVRNVPEGNVQRVRRLLKATGPRDIRIDHA
ncbi:MAG: hypothetical protein E6I38_10655 [Chloroflexi bacterium]|nr:MAG: hypothetical protein E6I38_10655 [Chloroflexota bacterium]